MSGAITALSTRTVTWPTGPFQDHTKGDQEMVYGPAPTRVAMEAGVHSIWISEQLLKFGHEVIVANIRELRAISHSDSKSDQVDVARTCFILRQQPS
jgi:transposase